MEDGLAVYQRPYDRARPVVCLDETSRQVLGERRWWRRGNRPATIPKDTRGGVANLFLVCEPLRGWREVRVSEHRTRLDWAACVKDLVDAHDPNAERVVLVLHQLNIDSPASLSDASPRPRRSI